MVLLSALRNAFSLDTLDTRLATRSAPKGRPLSSPRPRSSDQNPPQSLTDQQPKWNTWEFYIYYVIFLFVVPTMFKVTYDLSREDHPNYKKFERLLSDGWIPGRKVDNSDSQYQSVRNNLPILFLVLSIHGVLRKLFDYVYRRSSDENPDQRLSRRAIFDLIFAMIFLATLHGFSVLKILFILTVNFFISTKFEGHMLNPILTWIFNVGILFSNEIFEGYKYAYIFPWFAAGEGSGFGHRMDQYGGLISRWEIHFNITMLRLVSYNMDYYWSHKYEGGSVLELSDWESRGENGSLELTDPQKKRQLDGGKLSERDRIETPCKREDYSFLNYLAYALYSPLYLAGPIITFNDFISQLRSPLPTVAFSRTLRYGFRLLVSILCMELILHYMYVVAISKTASQGSWEGDSPFQLSMIGYFNLHIIWLKLLIPWRFFRFWSLVDGVDPPENMVRCMSNNYSINGFWKSWHRSFNKWILRYIYIPLGGSNRLRIVNTLAVFTFVALWHDLSLRLLAWGWLVTLFILPGVIANKIFPEKKFEGRPTLYRHLCALGGVGNILMMMVANLVGFAIGLDGLKELVSGILGGYHGAAFFVCACVGLWVGVQVMFEVREDEKREGIDLKC